MSRGLRAIFIWLSHMPGLRISRSLKCDQEVTEYLLEPNLVVTLSGNSIIDLFRFSLLSKMLRYTSKSPVSINLT